MASASADYIRTVETAETRYRDIPYGRGNPVGPTLYAGDKITIDCKLTNSHGNTWVKTPYSALHGGYFYLYGGHLITTAGIETC